MDVRRAAVEDVTERSKLVLHAKAHWGYSKNAQLQAWRASLEVSAESISAQPTFIAELNGLVIGFYFANSIRSSMGSKTTFGCFQRS
jgi:hypothetical protein